jgi:hypothetical protein
MNQHNCKKDRQMNTQTISSIKCTLSIVVLSLLAACGGGGGGGGSSSNTSTISGVVMDGYIKGATVCLDVNSNGVCDPGEPTQITGADGSYSFTYLTSLDLSKLNVIASVPASAVDSDNPASSVGVSFTLITSATQPLVVSPLTTLVSQYVTANPGATADAAATQVTAALGLPAGTNLFENYMAVSATTAIDPALHNVAQVMNAVIQASNLGTAPTAASLNAAIAVAATYVPTVTAADAIAPNSNIVANLLSSGTVTAAATAASGASTGNLITSVPTPTYTADNLSLFTQINAIRQNAGAGLVSQNTVLDTAAASHASYLVNNNLVSNGSYLNSTVGGILGGHYEDSTLSGFTGSTPSARATAARYASSGTVSELLSFGSAGGTDCSASIENSVYHLVQLISPFLDVGLSFNAGNGSGSVCGIELGIATGSGQFPPSGSWVSYPASGQAGVPPTFYNQAESPVPAADLQLAGHPIVISLYNQTNTSLSATDIVLHTFTLAAAGSSVGTRVLAQSGVTTNGTALTTDANISGPGILVLLPTSPLSANTVYTVTFSAAVKGTAVSKSWSFTTGSAN